MTNSQKEIAILRSLHKKYSNYYLRIFNKILLIDKRTLPREFKGLTKHIPEPELIQLSEIYQEFYQKLTEWHTCQKIRIDAINVALTEG